MKFCLSSKKKFLCMECSRWLYDTILEPACLYVTKKYKIITTGQRQNRAWSDLPPEILSLIAERAGLFELLSFFRVCNSWHSASSTALAHIVGHEINKGPWFVLYEDKNSECQLLTSSGKKFTTSLPELDGTTCLATYGAWFLLFKKGGSMFFFHVLLRQRIDLPKFPVPELTDHVGAVSSSPTSQDCVVCVISCRDDKTLDAKLHFLGKKTYWIVATHYDARVKTDTIKSAVYHNGKFCIFDGRLDNMSMMTLSIENSFPYCIWKYVTLVKANPRNSHKDNPSKSNVFQRHVDELKNNLKDMKKKLGLTEDVSISTCGTITPLIEEDKSKFIFNESVSDNDDKSKNRRFKGVWIQPRSSARRW
uniref:uncharacterized protein LOC101296544 isoform X3 n=1 Tax=Fragaria vesca subsp. vesca TaxID=101020 RepID=UPI0005CAE304|nr:PREDICTED: uncharacterized protein LOC101296544 isoform X3 [Fragaria vesca subsp. vesca]